MRSGVDRNKLLAFIREQTIDIDLKLDSEPKAISEAIAVLKERLSINVELASPDQFLPPLPGWRDRSEFITRSAPVDFFHYDLYSQVLSKVLRGHQKDISDARAFVNLGKVDLSRLASLFQEIESELIRYPAIDAASYRKRVEDFIESNAKQPEE